MLHFSENALLHLWSQLSHRPGSWVVLPILSAAEDCQALDRSPLNSALVLCSRTHSLPQCHRSPPLLLRRLITSGCPWAMATANCGAAGSRCTQVGRPRGQLAQVMPWRLLNLAASNTTGYLISWFNYAWYWNMAEFNVFKQGFLENLIKHSSVVLHVLNWKQVHV